MHFSAFLPPAQFLLTKTFMSCVFRYSIVIHYLPARLEAHTLLTPVMPRRDFCFAPRIVVYALLTTATPDDNTDKDPSRAVYYDSFN